MFKPFIENVSLDNIRTGNHYDAGDNSMLIQISDPDMEFPEPKYAFKEIRQYKFLDVENDDERGIIYKDAITDNDAKLIADDLKHALEHHMNIIVHCHAGICRSGAVCEVGVVIGFQDTERFRSPNTMVKRKLMEQLGLTYSQEETSSHATWTVSGVDIM